MIEGLLVAYFTIGILLAGPVTYGMTFAYFTREFPFLSACRRWHALGPALLFGVWAGWAWPIVTPAVWVLSRAAKHGLMFHPEVK